MNWYRKVVRDEQNKIYKLIFLREDLVEQEGRIKLIKEGYLFCTEEEGNELIKTLNFSPVHAMCGDGFAEFKYYP